MKDPCEPELRLGRWQDVAVDIEADVVICDPPYGGRTHVGAAAGARADEASSAAIAPSYTAWTSDDVHEFVVDWSPRTRGWMLVRSAITEIRRHRTIAVRLREMALSLEHAYHPDMRKIGAELRARINGL